MKHIPKKPKRYIKKVFLHCSASDLPQHDNLETIKNWHLERGFSAVGYHFVITKDGTVYKGRNLELIPAAQEGFNTGSIAICLTGNTTFSQMQFESLRQLCSEINCLWEDITFHGHCEVSKKLCPVFDYKQVLNLKEGKIPKEKTVLAKIQTTLTNILELVI